jgi:HK97 family phage portal protein
VGVRDALGRIAEQYRAELRAELVARPAPALRPETLGPALTIEQVIADSIAARESGFTLAQACEMPPVIRAKMLLTTIAAQLPATLYRDGAPAEVQPRIVTNPYRGLGRHRIDMVSETIDGLIDHGEAFWRLVDPDAEGRPQGIVVLPWDTVEVDWYPRAVGITPRYRFRGKELLLDTDLKHIAIGRKAGELRGRGPLTEGLPYLAAIDAAERYAAGWYGSGGIPSVVLRSKADVNEQQSLDIKAKWMAAHADGIATPAVLGGGIEDSYPDTDPARSQLQEARSFGATVVARLLGIPGPLLLIETSGSTITYQNATAALGELVKGTLAPTYLSPIEAAWSDLVGSRATVRFDLGELQRADLAARVGIYKELIPLGVVDPAEVRTWEGWGPVGSPTPQSALRPSPLPRPLLASEVPA